jgi:hypothetical protein
VKKARDLVDSVVADPEGKREGKCDVLNKGLVSGQPGCDRHFISDWTVRSIFIYLL